ncbi:hypothetical protein BJ138DRAFT_1105714 [Hygrophoropsis aurantiaca]|uniref:Uncharacterized protein n=1 Tax=Hygrophoropsis aurantiaca TaxID=72124 RepID=A0ACB7ZYF5_9AGAM|nr:hypothetical protein BJ138DRAFT_1105714 [Hygrophoropsis aurantiaca]
MAQTDDTTVVESDLSDSPISEAVARLNKEQELDEAPEAAAAVTAPKKRGRPRKNAAPKDASAGAILPAQPSAPAPKPPKINYYIAVFSKSQMQNDEKKRKLTNKIFQLSAAHEWDTLKAQILEKTVECLDPKTISWDDYDITWFVPRIQPTHFALASSSDYAILLEHAMKPKTAAASIVVEARQPKTKNTKGTSSKGKNQKSGSDADSSNSDDSNDSDSDGGKPVKKKSKTQQYANDAVPDKKKGAEKETQMNTRISDKIKLLRNKYACSKPGCGSGSEYCFIHPESPDHFPLSHAHLTIWASAWEQDSTLANAETPPNHAKFNALPGRHALPMPVSPLLQRRLAEKNQAQALPANGPAFSLVDFINVLRQPVPAAIQAPPPAQPVVTHVNPDKATLLPHQEAGVRLICLDGGGKFIPNWYCRGSEKKILTSSYLDIACGEIYDKGV